MPTIRNFCRTERDREQSNCILRFRNPNYLKFVVEISSFRPGIFGAFVLGYHAVYDGCSLLETRKVYCSDVQG